MIHCLRRRNPARFNSIPAVRIQSRPNPNFVQQLGHSQELWCQGSAGSPRVLWTKSDKFPKLLEMVKDMGFKPESGLFIDAVRAMTALSSRTWDAKIELYAEEVMLLFRKQPGLVHLSEQMIRKKVEYLMKELEWSPPYILRNPCTGKLSLEKRIIPRHRFLQFLASRGGLIKKNEKYLAKSFMMADERFLMKYESTVPNIFQIYEVLIEPKQRNIKDGEDHGVHSITFTILLVK